MAKMKYKTGDKVKVREDLNLNTKYYNSKKVESESYYASRDMVDYKGKFVTISRVLDHAYTIEEDSYGFRWTDEMFESVEQKIVITTDGKETIALLYRGSTVVESAVSKCNPEDTFDFVTGASLAFDRLVKEVTKKAEFKPGDRCKIVDNTCSHYCKIGDIITLTEKTSIDTKAWRYKEHYGYVTEKDIIHYVEDTKATEKPVTYKAGDKVKVIANTCCHDRKIGSIITLKSPYVADERGDRWFYEESGCYIRPCDFKMYQTEEDQLYTGKVICVKSEFPEYWTVGKVYEVKNGVTYTNTKSKRDGITSETLAHIGSKSNEFIPYIEAESNSKKSKYYTGKAVCTKSDDDFTVGKIYDIVNGKLKDDNGDARPTTYSLTSPEEYSRRSSIYAFIPLVEDKPAYYNGKVLCVDDGSNGNYTKGKAYQFKNGVFVDDTGFEMNIGSPVKTFEEWKKWSSAEWLEVIE